MSTAISQIPEAGGAGRLGDLAIALQEAFTVAVRLRANRQVAADAVSFRTHIKALLGAADRDARSRGYTADTVKLAIYAFIAFLDESVLNSSQTMFSDWTRQPLQEEVFGEHMAGENFFRYLTDLLGRQDSAEMADLLEVYLLCLLLGFRGKYAAGDPANLQGLTMSVQQKIQRIRGPQGLPRAWVLPQNEVVEATADPWVRRLRNVALATLVLAVAAWIAWRLLLGSMTDDIRAVAVQLIGG